MCLVYYCKECKFLFTCHGECPKNHVLNTPDGDPSLNWLCSGQKFFKHTEEPMKMMSELLRRGQTALEIIKIIVEKEECIQSKSKIGRNDPRFCGSGLKYEKCHGQHV